MFAAAMPWDALARLDARALFDILLISIVIYYLLNLLRGTRAVQICVALLAVVAVYFGARWARLEMVEWLLGAVLPYVAIALIVLFQPEIRRALARAGQNPFWQRFSTRGSNEAQDEVVLAVRHFSQNRVGALIVFERQSGLRTYIESGIPLDATLSYDLLLSIFRPGSPLHDGAAILGGNRVAAASCFLPLSLNPVPSNQLGTRHRAAIGVTEESDAVAVVVSEQTGAIALAAGGAMEMNLTPDHLAERLADLLAGRAPAKPLRTPESSTEVSAEASLDPGGKQ